MIDGEEESGPVELLLVDDNPSDHVLMKEALKRGNISNNLSITVPGDVVD